MRLLVLQLLLLLLLALLPQTRRRKRHCVVIVVVLDSKDGQPASWFTLLIFSRERGLNEQRNVFIDFQSQDEMKNWMS